MLCQLEESVSAAFQKGGANKGTAHDVHGHWVHFDGRRLHYALPFEGERFNLMFFVNARWMHISPRVRSQLQKAGLPLPGRRSATSGEVVAAGFSPRSGSGACRQPYAHDSGNSQGGQPGIIPLSTAYQILFWVGWHPEEGKYPG